MIGAVCIVGDEVKLISGNFRCSEVPNLATSDLFRTVCFRPGTFRVTVPSVVLTNTVPCLGDSVIQYLQVFLTSTAAIVFRASSNYGLLAARGSSHLDACSRKVRGTSSLSCFASSSFLAVAALTFASLPKSSSSHLSFGTRSPCPMMSLSKYVFIVLDQSRLFQWGFVVTLIRAAFGLLLWCASSGDTNVGFFRHMRKYFVI